MGNDNRDIERQRRLQANSQSDAMSLRTPAEMHAILEDGYRRLLEVDHCEQPPA